ncbi:MAG: hypothetical protein AAF456_13175 [Planctomycetota bacterium]
MRNLPLAFLVMLGFTLLPASTTGTSFAQSIDVSVLGNLPCRYNGRLSNLNEVSRSYAIRCGGGETTFSDSSGRTYSSLDWFVRIVAQDEDLRRIRFLPASPELANRLGLVPLDQERYSIAQVAKVIDKMFDESEAILAQSPEMHSALDLELLSMQRKLSLINDLALAHRSPWSMASDELVAELEFLEAFESQDVPRLVIPADSDSGRWSVLFPSAVRQFAVEASGDETIVGSPYARQLVELFDAIKNEKPGDFEAALKKTAQSLENIPSGTVAIRFEVPDGWVEREAGHPFEQSYYSDAFSTGIPVATLNRYDEGDQFVGISINHFPGQEISPLTLCNSWRITYGLAPIDEPAFQNTVKNYVLPSGKAWETDIVDVISGEPTRTVTRIIRNEAGTWTISLNGDAAGVAESLGLFSQFLDGLSIPPDVSKWISANETGEIPEQSALAIICRGDSHDWLLTVVGEADALFRSREELIEIMRNIEAPVQTRTDSGPVWRKPWPSPANWHMVTGPEDNRRAYFMAVEGDDYGLSVELAVVDHFTEDELVTLANHLRLSVQRPALPREEAGETIENLVEDSLVIIPVGFRN